MKAKEVKIHIKSNQTDHCGEKNDIEFYAHGKFGLIGDTKVLSYEESPVTGLEGSKSTIKIKGNEISLTRMGKSRVNFVFKLGEKTNTMYNTEYGDFQMEVYTHEICINIDEQSQSKVYLRYTLDIHHIGSFLNELFLNFK